MSLRGPHRVRTNAVQDGRLGTLLAGGIALALVPLGWVAGVWFVSCFGVLLGLVSLLGLYGLLQRVRSGGPSVELLDDPVAGRPLGIRVVLPGDARMVVAAEVQIGLRTDGRSLARQARAEILRTEGRSVELLVELPEIPEPGTWTWDLRIRPVSLVPFVGQEMPNESLEVAVSGLVLLDETS